MNAIVSLNGSVQGQGVRVDADDWLNIGSETWQKTPPAVKAAAYQAALAVGWKEEGLFQIITRTWKVDEDMAKFTLDTLKELAAEYPFEVEELKKDESKPPVWKIKDCDRTLPFPEK